jgi:hypothetical protein
VNESATAFDEGILWGWQDGSAVLHLVAQAAAIPDHAHARYSFKSSGELAYGAHQVPIVQCLDGRRIEGEAFTNFDGANEFLELKKRRALAGGG